VRGNNQIEILYCDCSVRKLFRNRSKLDHVDIRSSEEI
jgi:hypothetical protein